MTDTGLIRPVTGHGINAFKVKISINQLKAIEQAVKIIILDPEMAALKDTGLKPKFTPDQQTLVDFGQVCHLLVGKQTSFADLIDTAQSVDE